jgi:threonine aldolase
LRTFRSDNNAGLCPEAMQALIEANDGAHLLGYGDDVWTQRAGAAFAQVFGDAAAVFFVATGTAANVLAIAALTEPWQQIICHAHSHLADDESTAPERITHLRTVPILTESSKITPAALERVLGRGRGDVHQPQPGVVTLSNPTEFGEVYRPEELRTLCDLAHAAGYRIHVDGARFANAVASLGVPPRALADHAGVDALSFGGTKNGLAASEAVVFFPQGDGRAFERARHAFPYHRKGTGHLLSKHRFLVAPFVRTLADGVWLRHAGHANAMARRLGDGLRGLGLEPRFPVEANGVFVRLPDRVDAALQEAGQGYYPFGIPDLPCHRLMCSFDTDADDVDRLLALARDALR